MTPFSAIGVGSKGVFTVWLFLPLLLGSSIAEEAKKGTMNTDKNHGTPPLGGVNSAGSGVERGF